MTRLITLLLLFFLMIFQSLIAQESFEDKAKQIGVNIQNITKEEKEKLKNELKKLEDAYKNGNLDQATYEAQKQEKANMSALEMERRIGLEETQLVELVKMTSNAELTTKKDSLSGRVKNFKITYNNDKYISNSKSEGETRTTSQFVFAFGLNNLIDNESFGSLEDTQFSTWGSRFYEWGITLNTRILKNHNLLHAKYGFSVMYNNLRPNSNQFFDIQGNQTNLETAAVDLRHSRLRNVYLVLPLHLEFDFSRAKTNKDGKRIFYTHQAPRIGIGGYGGLRVKSKQKLAYEIDDVRFFDKQLDDFNATNFIYGLSAYVGYENVSLYFKYDLNSVFQNNLVAQNNVSLGLRFDFD